MADNDLHERDQALRAVSEALAAAREGAGRVLLLQGDAGVGKTTLLGRARVLAGADIVPVQARGAVMERDLPFAFVDQLSTSGPAPGRETRDDPGDRRAAVYAAARAQMRSWATAGPAVVLLDDLQWADLDSLAVIGFLARRLARLPIAMIGALRPWPAAADGLAAALAHEGVAEIVAVPALSEDAAAHVLEDRVGGRLAGQFKTDAWRLTAGNPLLLVQAGRTLRLTGALPAPGEGGGERLRQILLLSHMAGVGKAATACAQAVAVLGGPARAGAARAVCGLDQEAFAAALDSLGEAGVLRVDGRSLRFTHDLVGSAVYHDMGPTHRALLHGRAFTHQLDHGDVAAAATHAIAAGLDDGCAIAAIADAGELALSAGAVETGLHQLAAAVALAGPAPPDELLARHADALFASGRALEALDAYRRLLERPLDPPGRQAALMRAARAQAYAGRLRDSLETYDDLVAAAGGLPATPVPVLLERAHVVWELDGPVAALAALGERGADGSGEMHEIARGAFALEAGDPSGVPAVARAARAARASLVKRPGENVDSFNIFLVHAGVCGMTERYDEAEEYIESGTSSLRAAGVAWATVPLRISRIGILCHRGALVQAITETEDIDEELQASPLLLPYLLALRARALIWLGRLDDAAALCDRAEELPGGGSWFVRLYVTMNRAEHRWAGGRLGDAARLYRDAAGLAHELGIREPCLAPWAAGAIETALATGRPDEAAEIVEWLQGCVEPLPCVWPRMVLLAGRAGCAAAAGDAAAAEAHYQEALALPEIAPLDRARVLLRYGAWLRRSNQARRARAPLAGALQVADERAAAPLAALASAELGAAGGRRRRPREDDGLTPQEARVAGIAVTGATTREIAGALHLSPRTVETHLSRVYLKLGVGSKQELRRRQAELAPALDPPARATA